MALLPFLALAILFVVACVVPVPPSRNWVGKGDRPHAYFVARLAEVRT